MYNGEYTIKYIMSITNLIIIEFINLISVMRADTQL